jgi:hypothetical protein
VDAEDGVFFEHLGEGREEEFGMEPAVLGDVCEDLEEFVHGEVLEGLEGAGGEEWDGGIHGGEDLCCVLDEAGWIGLEMHLVVDEAVVEAEEGFDEGWEGDGLSTAG